MKNLTFVRYADDIVHVYGKNNKLVAAIYIDKRHAMMKVGDGGLVKYRSYEDAKRALEKME
jgi:hypothetical protein